MKIPQFGSVTAVLAALVAIAMQFTDPSSLPILQAVFGKWTAGVVSACALILLFSRALQKPVPTDSEQQKREGQG